MIMPVALSDTVISSCSLPCLLTIEACQRYNLGHPHRRQGHECHERVFAILQTIQKLEARVVDGSGKGGRVLGYCRRHAEIVLGGVCLRLDADIETLEDAMRRLKVIVYSG